MPAKKTQATAIKTMEAKIATLEEEILGVKSTLTAMERNQATLIAMFEKSLGKSLMTEEESVVDKGGSVKGVGEGWGRKSENSSS
ncbi:hypothetical protein A2U01_0061695, partial [Trifolium medium]|nr:hypothetical protein [Trifolium medium]